MTDDDMREHLEKLLDDLEADPLPIPVTRHPSEARLRVPVVWNGKIIGHVNDPIPDLRQDEVKAHRNRIRALRKALAEGDEPWRIAWLALSVGAGTATPATREREIKRQGSSSGGKAKTGKTKAKPEQVQRLIEELRHAKGTSYDARVVKAIRKSGWPFSKSMARKIGEKAGMGVAGVHQ
ncbi:MAG: hypothetical protein H0T48_12595 [Gemmatimonadaceae bacterium]|nr:hypothetical protein [Gemmatimonadaceae bacterium]